MQLAMISLALCAVGGQAETNQGLFDRNAFKELTASYALPSQLDPAQIASDDEAVMQGDPKLRDKVANRAVLFGEVELVLTRAAFKGAIYELSVEPKPDASLALIITVKPAPPDIREGRTKEENASALQAYSDALVRISDQLEAFEDRGKESVASLFANPKKVYVRFIGPGPFDELGYRSMALALRVAALEKSSPLLLDISGAGAGFALSEPQPRGGHRINVYRLPPSSGIGTGSTRPPCLRP